MLKASSFLLDQAAREMEEYFDQRSDQWQESEAGESLAQILEAAQDAFATLEGILPQRRQTNQP